jgi:hypothetical protein
VIRGIVEEKHQLWGLTKVEHPVQASTNEENSISFFERKTSCCRNCTIPNKIAFSTTANGKKERLDRKRKMFAMKVESIPQNE